MLALFWYKIVFDENQVFLLLSLVFTQVEQRPFAS